jgi:hypothetical protein
MDSISMSMAGGGVVGAPKLLQNLGSVNLLSAFSRAREGRAQCARRAERAADAAPSDTRAANPSKPPDDHFRFRKFGSRRVMDSISMSMPAVVWWWSRASYGVSPTTPPIETAPTMGHWGVLSLWHFRLA